MKQFDAVIIGGGFYGCCIALSLAQHYDHVALIEKENRLMQKASSLNQARVHGGYHYPRSFMTATRSLINYSRFMNDFKDAIVDNVKHIYAIAKYGTKTNSKQFYNLFKAINAPIQRLPDTQFKLFFNPDLIENAFVVDEAIFNWEMLEKLIHEKLLSSGVKLLLNTEIKNITPSNDLLTAYTVTNNTYSANQIFSCVYSNLNTLQINSGLSLLPLKYEATELALVQPPDILEKHAITVMDGHFFSLLPYPQRKAHTLSHVRYTPHASWTDPHTPSNTQLASNFTYMKQDVIRYMPLLQELKYIDSLYEIKTILQRNEGDDGRPILFREEPTLPNFYTVMGSKIDNIYDVLDVILDKCVTNKKCLI